ncbi:MULTISPECIES: SPOR domain-containing protein [unclassified Halomonas]|uniref:SPOR domain-containing protein n=1 Tax=unclassified Halomonas TaxID=2609666 RepID=UPI00288482BB|nr:MULTISPECIES: SPOR domain-containing protein [unclassified Halomonas]MDT0499455.1 SPOR domain-containing protein [Halomonas sp. PAR7]MDT0510728.1 SPOR domain-containing protein [Halomonas sp. LES1]MDT0591743.1 SPOR domain-containing protein [Halomonas sp. PAR8]
MKYGMRERLSGAVILIALAVIFVPMLFDEPAPRDGRPEPSISIEAPIEVERHDVADPKPPASLSGGETSIEIPAPTPRLLPDDGTPSSRIASTEASGQNEAASSEQVPSGQASNEPSSAEQNSTQEPADTAPAVDPIAELARAADQRMAERPSTSSQSGSESVEPAVAQGEWAVQVGSFGKSSNVERLLAQLRDEGFNAYSRPRGNDLTTVYVGPFATSEAGERAVAEVKSRVNLQGLLVRVKE